MGRETCNKETNKIRHYARVPLSVDGEQKRVLKSTGEAVTFMLLIMMSILFSVNANRNVKRMLMNFIIAVKN